MYVCQCNLTLNATPPLPWALSWWYTRPRQSVASQPKTWGSSGFPHHPLPLLHSHKCTLIQVWPWWCSFSGGELLVFWLCQAAPVTGCWEQGAPVFPCSPITPDTQKQPDFFAWIVKTKRSIVSMSLLVCLRGWTLGARKTGTSDFFSPKKPLNLWIRTTQWSCTCLFQA